MSTSFRDRLRYTADLHGIKLVEIWPEYTSLIDSKTGEFGQRCREVTATKFMHDKWLREKVAEARERIKDGTSSPSDFDFDKYLITIDDQLNNLNPAKLAKAQNVYILDPSGPLFISGSPYCPSILNADLNASFNIGLKAVFDLDWPGRYFNILVGEDTVPNNTNYKGCPAITNEKLIADDPLEKPKKKEKSKKNTENAFFYLWRLSSSSPINASSSWRRTWDFFNYVRKMAVKNLLRRRQAISGSGNDP
jgi:hypothetical protein